MEQKPITVAYPFVGDIEVGGGHVTILVRIRNLDHRRFRPLIVVHGASNGTDRASCRRRLLEELDQPPDTRIIGFFASLRSHAPTQKRPPTFLETISILKSREGLGIEDRVRFMGFPLPPEPWLAACDAMLAPAVDEGFGRTVVEAMLVGTPVVAAASGAYPEIIEDMSTGLLVEPDRPAVHAEKVHTLLRDAALRACLTAQAREAAMARFAAEVHASGVMNLYERLLGLEQPEQEAGRRYAQGPASAEPPAPDS